MRIQLWEKTQKKLDHQQLSTEDSFHDDVNKETLNINKVCQELWKINGI